MYATTVCIVPPNTTCTTITKVETHFTAGMCSTILVHPLLSPI